MFIQTIFCCYNIKNRKEKTIFRSSAGPAGRSNQPPPSTAPCVFPQKHRTWKNPLCIRHGNAPTRLLITQAVYLKLSTPPKLLTSPPCEEPHTHKHHPHKTTEKLYNTAASKTGRSSCGQHRASPIWLEVSQPPYPPRAPRPAPARRPRAVTTWQEHGAGTQLPNNPRRRGASGGKPAEMHPPNPGRAARLRPGKL